MAWTSINLFRYLFNCFVIKNAAYQGLGFEDDPNVVNRVFTFIFKDQSASNCMLI